ncbi:DUF2062 domain-containing protein [Candidatus Nitrospira allomarina]|jgi:uncharacterized protein|uniref:DUF2062 domain-containing protein n=1 Tax=Candidatus Nitrospira allomarina TaxID=3020900 RepID=A0AA96JR89_9BACT|nr:DUF2062 domain-containing protein [Candidatus Nitrospira allomarina]WNM56848.1 DUF2062 domain-containing protein [Candidatus Nitrospira allomarina]
MVTLESVRQQLTQVLHLRETPHRTALAFALGVFIAFAPHYLFHTASVVFCAWAFRLNFLALFLGSLINNPWTLIPILAASLYTGMLLIGASSSATIEWDQMRVDNIFDMLSPYLIPFLVGACALSIVGSLIAYPVMRWVITRYRGLKNS